MLSPSHEILFGCWAQLGFRFLFLSFSLGGGGVGWGANPRFIKMENNMLMIIFLLY